MALESVGNVVATVLRRSETNEMSIASLHPFCVRLYFEHLLPSSQLTNQDLPVELANPGSLLQYLRGWDPNIVAIVGEEGSWSARLVQAGGGSTQMNHHVMDTGVAGSESSSDHSQPSSNRQAYEPLNKAANGSHPDSGFSDSKNGQWDETTYVRQLVCMTLLDYVLHTQGALHHTAAASLEDTRSQCIQLLVKAFPEAPPELLTEEGLEDLLLSQGNKYMITLSAGRRKMVFKPTDVVPENRAFPNAAGPIAGFQPAPVGHTPVEGYQHKPLPDYADLRDNFLGNSGDPQTPSPVPPIVNESSTTSVVETSQINSPFKAGEKVQNLKLQPQPAQAKAVHAPPPTHSKDIAAAATAYLRKHKIFDGPKSVPVEKLRSVLLAEHGQEADASSPLTSLKAFRELLEEVSGMKVWVSKASDVLRCMLDPDTPVTENKASVTATAPPKLAEVVSAAPSIYKAVHLYLAGQQPPASSPEAAVKAHILLKAVRAHSVGTSWHSHPALHSIPQLLKYMKNDTALVFTDDGDAKDGTVSGVWMKPQHGSFKVATKTLQEGASQDADATSDSRAPTSDAVPAPTSIPSGYPQLGSSIEVWGPTSDANVLRAFIAQYGATKMWGFDYKTNVPPKAHFSNSSKVTLLTLSTCRACLMWDMWGASELPPELEDWLQDGGMRKCRMSAKGAVNVLASALGVEPAGFLDLRELCRLSVDDFNEGSMLTLPAIASSVLSVRIIGHQQVMKSNWAQRPLQPAQKKYTVQNAWFHAHLLQSLGSALEWDTDKMDTCLCEARPGLLHHGDSENSC